MKGIRYVVGILIVLMLAACSKQPASELVTGRWASLDRQSIILVDIPNGLFNIYQVTQIGPIAALVAENLKVVEEQQNPHQVIISYDFAKKKQKTIIRINWRDDDTYTISLINTLTGAEQELSFVSRKPTLEI